MQRGESVRASNVPGGVKAPGARRTPGATTAAAAAPKRTPSISNSSAVVQQATPRKKKPLAAGAAPAKPSRRTTVSTANGTTKSEVPVDDAGDPDAEGLTVDTAEQAASRSRLPPLQGATATRTGSRLAQSTAPAATTTAKQKFQPASSSTAARTRIKPATAHEQPSSLTPPPPCRRTTPQDTQLPLHTKRAASVTSVSLSIPSPTSPSLDGQWPSSGGPLPALRHSRLYSRDGSSGSLALPSLSPPPSPPLRLGQCTPPLLSPLLRPCSIGSAAAEVGSSPGADATVHAEAAVGVPKRRVSTAAAAHDGATAADFDCTFRYVDVRSSGSIAHRICKSRSGPPSSPVSTCGEAEDGEDEEDEEVGDYSDSGDSTDSTTEDSSDETAEDDDEEGTDEDDEVDSTDEEQEADSPVARRRPKGVRLTTKVSREGDRNVKVLYIERKTRFDQYVREAMHRFGYENPTDFDMYCIDELGDHVDIDLEEDFRDLISTYWQKAGATAVDRAASGRLQSQEQQQERKSPRPGLGHSNDDADGEAGARFLSEEYERSSGTVIRLYVRDSYTYRQRLSRLQAPSGGGSHDVTFGHSTSATAVSLRADGGAGPASSVGVTTSITSTALARIMSSPDSVAMQFAETQRKHLQQTFVFKESEEVAWTKMSVLGRGSFGTVYEGITSDGKLLAVKVQELPLDEDAEETKALQKEINLMRTLKHKNIVAYYGCQTRLLDSGAKQMEIFMELCHGGSLTSLRRKFEKAHEPFGISLVRSYTRQILDGLSYLHTSNVMHRDIKSDNVLISAMGEAKLADFGCSKRISTTTAPPITATSAGAAAPPAGMYQTMVGTPFFMAPEVMREDSAGYSFPADVWSVGCLVLELLGRQPWVSNSGGNMFQILYQISQAKTMPTGIPKRCPAALLDFFTKCFDRDTSRRPSAAQLLLHEWITCPDSALEEVLPD